jgi:hypothetical protein
MDFSRVEDRAWITTEQITRARIATEQTTKARITNPRQLLRARRSQIRASEGHSLNRLKLLITG